MRSIADVFQDVFADWAAANPGVQLEVSMMPALEQHKAKLLLAAAAGRLPDVASIDSFWLPLFLEGGHLQPLNPHWPADDRADFLPFTIETLSDRQGNVYGVWHETDCRALFYRKDLVPVPPRDLGRAAGHGEPRGHASAALPGTSTTPAGGRRRCSTTCRCSGRRAASWSTATAARCSACRRTASAWCACSASCATPCARGASPRAVLANNDYKQLSAAAIAGDVAMFLGGNWQIKELKDALPPDEFAKWGIAPIPQDQRGPAPTGTGGWIWVVFSQDPEKQKAAAASSCSTSRRRTTPPASAAAPGGCRSGAACIATTPRFARSRSPFFGDMLGSARARPAVPIYNAISRELQIAIGYAIEGTRTPEQAVDAAWTTVMAEYDSGQAPAGRAARASIRWRGSPVLLALALGGGDAGSGRSAQPARLAGARRRPGRGRSCSTRCSSSCASPSPTRRRRAAATATPWRGSGRCPPIRSSTAWSASRSYSSPRRWRCNWRWACCIAWLFDAAERRRVVGAAGGARRGGERVGDSRAC